MFVGRASIITLALRKKIDKQLEKGVPKPTEYLEKLKQKPKQNKLVFRNIPFTGWIFGLLLVGVGLFLDIWAIMGKHWFFFSEFDDGYVYQFMASLFCFLMGFIFFFSVDIEILTLDRQNMIFKFEKINILAMKTKQVRNLEDLKDIVVINKGLFGRATSTVYFVLQFQFDIKDKIEPLEFKDRAQAKLRLIEINYHLNRTINVDIKVEDKVNYLRPKINYNEMMPLRRYYIDKAKQIMKKQRDEEQKLINDKKEQ